MLTKWLILQPKWLPSRWPQHGGASFPLNTALQALEGICQCAWTKHHKAPADESCNTGLRAMISPLMRFQQAPLSSHKRSFLSKRSLLSCLCPRQNPTLSVPFHSTYMTKKKPMAKSTPLKSTVLSHHELVSKCLTAQVPTTHSESMPVTAP